ncbi:hypothetical protein LSTR_LSTR016255 [Laodelphax striatellus]|uniref:tRNA (carboxymethyluridine(34)-5-O)-methyltransferase n=1 Tax=Laodelphax striatellus TaxID=195883 RepID=A0A482WYA9_LAOST|nr:hypothetical protein LSTR_LSTR016255 [Laodelphax striatellus]
MGSDETQILTSKKSRRKFDKKENKYKHFLSQFSGIQHSPEPTKFLMICNAGLVNGFDEGQAVELFSKYGRLVSVSMLAGKSFCFVTFSETADARHAFENLNGKWKLEKMLGPIYMIYTTSAPSSKMECTGRKPNGLSVLENFITEDEERDLLNSISFHNTTHSGNPALLKHRRVKHYGYEFQYSNNNVNINEKLPESVPKACDILGEKLKKHGWTNPRWPPDQLTVNEYQPGQEIFVNPGIPAHIDTHSAFESPIMSLSLLSDCVMEFRHADGSHFPLHLPRRSMLIMDGEARYDWTHAIKPRKMDIIYGSGPMVIERGRRISFTFRWLRAGGCCQCNYRDQCDSQTAESALNLDCDASRLESQHVHQVYNKISSHFSQTRYRAWPNVAQFVSSLPCGSVLFDVGCGNGKYFGLNRNIFEVGGDRSDGLLTECWRRGFESVQCDCLQLPLRCDSVDGLICIAVIHHLSTHKRRVAAIGEMARVLRRGGRGLVYVWAKDQSRDNVPSKYLKQEEGQAGSDGKNKMKRRTMKNNEGGGIEEREQGVRNDKCFKQEEEQAGSDGKNKMKRRTIKNTEGGGGECMKQEREQGVRNDKCLKQEEEQARSDGKNKMKRRTMKNKEGGGIEEREQGVRNGKCLEQEEGQAGSDGKNKMKRRTMKNKEGEGGECLKQEREQGGKNDKCLKQEEEQARNEESNKKRRSIKNIEGGDSECLKQEREQGGKNDKCLKQEEEQARNKERNEKQRTIKNTEGGGSECLKQEREQESYIGRNDKGERVKQEKMGSKEEKERRGDNVQSKDDKKVERVGKEGMKSKDEEERRGDKEVQSKEDEERSGAERGEEEEEEEEDGSADDGFKSELEEETKSGEKESRRRDGKRNREDELGRRRRGGDEKNVENEEMGRWKKSGGRGEEKTARRDGNVKEEEERSRLKGEDVNEIDNCGRMVEECSNDELGQGKRKENIEKNEMEDAEAVKLLEDVKGMRVCDEPPIEEKFLGPSGENVNDGKSYETHKPSEFSLPVHNNRTQFKHDDILVPWTNKNETFFRYYHVFREGELEELCSCVSEIQVEKVYYDQGNWCVVFEKCSKAIE